MQPITRRIVIAWCGLAALAGCIGGEEPLPPKEALARAAARIDTLLAEESNQGPFTFEPGQPVEDPNAVTFWHYSHPLLARVFDRPDTPQAFLKAHPSVTLHHQYIGEWQHAVQKLTVSVAAGDMPDVALVERSWLSHLVPSGRVARLDAFAPADLSPTARAAFTVDGCLYGLPADGFCNVLFFNEDLVGDTPPATWSDLRALALRLHDQLETPIGHFPYPEALWSAGGKLLDGDRSGLHDSSALEALEFVLSLRNDGLARESALVNPQLSFAQFLRGEVAVTVGSSSWLTRTSGSTFQVGMAPVPGKAGPVSRLSDYALVVFQRHAEARRPAIAALLDFLTGPEVQGADALSLGSVPSRGTVRAGLARRPGLYAAYDAALAPPLLAVWPSAEFELNRHLQRAFLWDSSQMAPKP